jgi:hypothetical protein
MRYLVCYFDFANFFSFLSFQLGLLSLTFTFNIIYNYLIFK